MGAGQNHSSYDLGVYDWENKKEVLHVRGVGFPTGRGPILSDTHVVWEAVGQQGMAQLRMQRLPER